MPENTSKLLGFLEDLAIIADNAPEGVGTTFVTLYPNSSLVEVHLGPESLEELKKHYPGKVEVRDQSEEYIRESMIFFDTVKVFTLIRKPKAEIDINVTAEDEPAQVAAI